MVLIMTDKEYIQSLKDKEHERIATVRKMREEFEKKLNAFNEDYHQMVEQYKKEVFISTSATEISNHIYITKKSSFELSLNLLLK